jgi:ribosome-binding ATPase
MGFSIGLVGLPNAGKTTIFNALSNQSAQTANFPFTTINPNVAIVEIPDERLKKIAEIVKPPKLTHSTIECIDIAGLVEGASKGQGLGNKFLEHIRMVDAIVHVVRCFKNDDVPLESGAIDPEKDLSLIETELLMADLDIAEKRLEKTKKAAKSGEKELVMEKDFLQRMVDGFKKGEPARKITPSVDEAPILKEMNLLTSKQAMYVANLSEGTDKNLLEKAKQSAVKRGSELIIIDGKLESELKDLSNGEKAEFLKEYGYSGTSLERFLKSAYNLLNIITFYTIKGDETRAWLLEKGGTALDAAGKIHTDIAKGFIKAEVSHYSDFLKYGSFDEERKAGHLEVAGKEYIVQDGDLILFKFK